MILSRVYKLLVFALSLSAIYAADFGDIPRTLALGSGTSVRRNAGDTAFEAYIAVTPTATATSTATPTGTPTSTPTPAGNVYASATPLAQQFAVWTDAQHITGATATATFTPTPTATATATATATSTATNTATPTATSTATPSATPAGNVYASATPLAAGRLAIWQGANAIADAAATATATSTFTPTATATSTATFTPTNTPTPTATWTPLFTPTATSTATATPSATSTSTATATSTATPAGNVYASATPLANQLAIFTDAVHITGATPTATATPSATATPTATAVTLAGLGGVPTTRTLTIAGTALDLSADRAWTQDTITGLAATGIVQRTAANTLGVASADQANGTSSSGTATTLVAQIAAAAGNQLVDLNLVASQASIASTQFKIIITYSDATTTTVSSAALTADTCFCNYGGCVLTAAGAGTGVTAFSAKKITTARVETLGSGTGARYGSISALEIKQ